jgi:hypothetical protein
MSDRQGASWSSLELRSGGVPMSDRQGASWSSPELVPGVFGDD